eukprot:TRINITY_DN9708_c0_g2_i1.p4 TRINITY_DN9708_c0_g2~~TRINITY_DN9708_c0_g2_i1.p4  ORF type:complete len:101 (+),score=9.85 TRINITY_DN9708_c0_g2_i1:1803-2105(+)
MLKSWLADQGFKDATACLDNLHAGISSLHVAAQLADVDVCFELSNRYPLLIHARYGRVNGGSCSFDVSNHVEIVTLKLRFTTFVLDLFGKKQTALLLARR